MEGHKVDGDFHPHTVSPGIKQSMVNPSSEVKDTTSNLGEKKLKEVKVKHVIGKLSQEKKEHIEAKIDSVIVKHSFGNHYVFKNKEEYLILPGTEDAQKESEQYLNNVWDAIGVLGWDRKYVESFVDEESLKREIGIGYSQLYGDNRTGSPIFNLAKKVPINKTLLIKESIKNDGFAHTLAKEDGKEIKMTDGTLLYRVN